MPHYRMSKKERGNLKQYLELRVRLAGREEQDGGEERE